MPPPLATAMPSAPHRDQPILQGGAPLSDASRVLVLLHGRGGLVQDMLTLAQEHPSFAWLAPEAAGRRWYPYSLLEKLEHNRPHLNSALSLLERVLDKAVAARVSPARVVLFGFSQGASVVLEFAVRHPRRYGAIIALSGALLGPEGTPRDYAGSLAETPVFLASGDQDPYLPKRRVDETAAVLERLGARVTRRVYPGLGHAINEEEKTVVRGMVRGR